MDQRYICGLSAKLGPSPPYPSRGRNQKEAILCPLRVQAGGMLVIKGILAWGRQRDTAQIHESTINLPFYSKCVFYSHFLANGCLG